jgi:hypothetical protein
MRLWYLAPGASSTARRIDLAASASGRTKAEDPLARVPWSTSSVSRVLSCAGVAPDAAAVIPLGRPLPDASSSLPASLGESPFAGSSCEEHRTLAYVALLPMGSALPSPLPETRWALTPPFHPCLPLPFPVGTGGLFSVALSFAFPRPGVTRHRALWSSDFPPAALRLSRLAPRETGSRPAIACSASTRRKVTPPRPPRNCERTRPRLTRVR